MEVQITRGLGSMGYYADIERLVECAGHDLSAGLAAGMGAALDTLGWLLTLYAGVSRWLSATFTVRWDPLGYSRQPIPTHSAKDTFTVGTLAAGTAGERERRIVAWFYRWHETPDDDDWRACLALFQLATCPAHTLRLESPPHRRGVEVEVAEIWLGGAAGRGSRTVAGARARISGPTPLGGLSPARLIKDAGA